MHLILGYEGDPCCSGVAARLQERGLDVRILAAPLAPPSRLVLRLGPELGDNRATASLALDDGPAIRVDSVLVRAPGGLDPAGWSPADHAYMQAEMQAALLAWLATLDCPVVNRLPAALWYRPRMPHLAWAPYMRRYGLALPEAVITDDPKEARGFARSLATDGVPGAVCTPLTREGAWLVGPGDWDGVARLQAHAPVCLSEPHGQAKSACIVGDALIWETPPDRTEAAIGSRMRRVAEACGLVFLEFALAPVRHGPAVVHLDPLPRLEHFGPRAAATILDALSGVLAGAPIAAPATAEVPA